VTVVAPRPEPSPVFVPAPVLVSPVLDPAAPAPVEPVPVKPARLVAADVIKLPASKACVSRRSFRIRLVQPKGTTIARVIVKVNGKRVKTVKGKRVTARVDLRGLPKGRFSVVITVSTADGRTLKSTRRYRTCAPRRKGY
jgi:hypothetical protein